MKRLIPSLFVVLFLCSVLAFTTLGASYSTSVFKVNQNIYINETAEFLLKIDNNLGYMDDFDVDVDADSRWAISTDPTVALTSEYGLSIANGDQREVILMITPVARVAAGWHLIPIIIRSKQSKQTVKEVASVYVRQTGAFEGVYLPSFAVELDVPQKTDPRQDLTVNVMLENRNYRNITKLNIIVTSDIFTKEFVTDLPPMSKKVETFVIDIDDFMDPTTISIEAEGTVETAERSFTARSISKDVQIDGYSYLKRSDVNEKEILRTKDYITLTNDGNVANSGEVRMQTTFFKRLFTRSNPQATLKDSDGAKYLVWEFTLGPQETAVIVISQNYRPLVIVLVVIVLLAAAYFLFRSPVVLKKSAARIVRPGKDPNFTELKVLLFIKNRTGKQISNLVITDRIPRIAEVEKEFQMGTLAPSKITKHDKRGTHIFWDLHAIDPYEERIITYRIRSTLAIIGGITLPSASVKFNVGKREMLIHSSRTSVDA